MSSDFRKCKHEKWLYERCIDCEKEEGFEYTVIYTESATVGSHQHTTVHMKHVRAPSVKDVYNMMDGAAVFVFEGRLQALGVFNG